MYNHFNEFITDDTSSINSEDEGTRIFDKSEFGGQTELDGINVNLSGKSCAIHTKSVENVQEEVNIVK